MKFFQNYRAKLSDYFSNTAFKSILISYLSMLFIPLFILSAGYFYTDRLVEEQTMDMQQALMEQLQTELDDKLQTLSSQNILLAQNSTIRQYAALPDNYSAQDLFRLEDVQSELASRKTITGLLNCSTVLYFDDSKLLVTADYIYNSATISAYANGVWGMTEEEFLQLAFHDISTSQTESIIDVNGEKFVFLIQKIYDTKATRALGAAVTTISLNRAVQSLTRSDWGNTSDYYLLSEQNSYYLGSESPYYSQYTPSYDAFLENTRPSYKAFRSGSYIVCGVPSQYNKWCYCILISRNELVQRLIYFRVFILCDAILFLLIGGLLAVRLSQFYYTPVQKLLHLMRDNKSQNNDRSQSIDSIFSSLEQAIIGLRRDNRSMEVDIYQKQLSLRRILMTNICTGRIREPDCLIADAEKIGIHLFDGSCDIILFSIYNMESSIFCYNTQDYPRVNFDLPFFSLCNVVEDVLFVDGYSGFTSEYNGNIVAIMQKSECSIPAEQESTFEQKIKRILTFSSDILHLKLYAALSGNADSLDQLFSLYQKAEQTRQYQEFWQGEVPEICSSTELEGLYTDNSQNYAQENRQFLNYLAVKDYKSAHQLLINQLELQFSRNPHQLQENKWRMYSIIISILDALIDQKNESDSEFFQQLNPSSQLLSVKTMTELKQTTDRVFQQIVQHYEQREKEQQPDWIDDVKNYIQNNYADPSLDLTAISESLGISVYYLSRMFKKYTSIGALDYIHITRINACKKLLEKGVSVKDAAEQTGYTDSKALIRTFKRYEGVTPGQYKNL